MLKVEDEVSLQGCWVRGNISVGYKSYANESIIKGNTTIGRYCSIGRRCSIAAPNHNVDWLTTYTVFNDPRLQPFNLRGREKRPTIIGNDVWIGDNVVIIEGINVGDGAVIAAGAVVTKDVLPYTIVGGVPAKTIRRRFSDETINQLLDLRWWDHEVTVLRSIPLDNIPESISVIGERIAQGHPKMPPHHRSANAKSFTRKKGYHFWRKLRRRILG